MQDDVTIIVDEIRRLARAFPGDAVPPQIVPGPAGRTLLDTARARVLRLSPPQRHALALAARGCSADRIARLTASGSTARTRVLLRAAADDLGLGPRIRGGFGSPDPGTGSAP